MSNHWRQLDISRVHQYTEPWERPVELKMTNLEWDRIDGDPNYADRPCSCGKVRQYRMTVGALQCPDCRSIETFAGKVVS